MRGNTNFEGDKFQYDINEYNAKEVNRVKGKKKEQLSQEMEEYITEEPNLIILVIDSLYEGLEMNITKRDLTKKEASLALE